MFAHAFLAAIRASGRDIEELQKGAVLQEEGKLLLLLSSSSLQDFKKRRGL